MNIQKVERVIYLQKKANQQIHLHGQVSDDVINELMELADNLTPEESEMFIKMYQ